MYDELLTQQNPKQYFLKTKPFRFKSLPNNIDCDFRCAEAHGMPSTKTIHSGMTVYPPFASAYNSIQSESQFIYEHMQLKCTINNELRPAFYRELEIMVGQKYGRQ